MMITFSIIIILITIIASILGISIIFKNNKKLEELEDKYIFKDSFNNDFDRFSYNYLKIMTTDIKPMLTAMIIGFTSMSFVFILMIFVELEIPELDEIAKEILDKHMIFIFQFIFMQAIIFIFYSFIRIRYINIKDNNIYINKQRLDVIAYEIKRFNILDTIYLQTEKKLWILAGSTMESRKKYPNRQIMMEEKLILNRDIDILEKFLISRGLGEKKYTIVRNIIISFGLLFIITAIMAISLILYMHY